MSVSSVHNGYPILHQSQKMADEVAYDIQQSAQNNNEFNNHSALAFNDAENVKVKQPSDSDIDSLIKLHQATQYNRVGTNVIQREQDMIGSLLDLHV